MSLAPYFSTAQSDWTALPGLYISERNVPTPFLGVTRNSVGVCGECVRGPVNTPISITDANYFRSIFGERDQGSGGATITGKIWQALLNKKFGEVIVVRAAATAAVAAVKTLISTGPVTNVTVTAANVGVWGNNMTVAVEAASDGVSTSFDMVIVYLGVTYRLKNCTVTGATDNLSTVIAEVWPDPYQRLITATKGTAGRPDNAAAAAFASGAEGTIADSDFTATDGPMEKLAARAGLAAVWIAERDHTTALKDKWETLAASSYDRLFLIGPQISTTTQASSITDVAAYRYERIVYLYNFPLTQDPTTATNITTRPESWFAGFVSQKAADVHPISLAAGETLVGVKDLTVLTTTRAGHILLKNAGITAMDFDQQGRARYADGLTTSLTSGKEDVAQRRMRDALQLDLAILCEPFVGEKNSTENRRMILAAVADYLSNKKTAQSIVQAFAAPVFSSTSAEEAAGLAKVLVRVKSFGHWKYLVIDTQIGPSVSIEESDTLPSAA